MDNMERMRMRYGPEVLTDYPQTGPGRAGFEQYSAMLTEGCAGRKSLRVLDLGCGNGRYFKCLSNVSLLIGIDISPHMLQAAELATTNLDALSDKTCVFLEADFQQLQFMPESLDLIYSFGVVGELTPLDQNLLESVVRWLAPDGKAYFTVVDKDSSMREQRNASKSTKNEIKKMIAYTPFVKLFPHRMAVNIVSSYDYSSFYKTRAELEAMLSSLPQDVERTIIPFRDAKHPKLGCALRKK
jgi:SAM-dependent methyltransferase